MRIIIIIGGDGYFNKDMYKCYVSINDRVNDWLRGEEGFWIVF